MDAVLFAERQYVLAGFDLAREARARGKLVCGIPMMEFVLDDEPWLEHADLLFAPTRWTLGELRALAERREGMRRATGSTRWRSPWAGRVVGGRFGADLALFAFRPRERCQRFLFVNGRGGMLARKGADLVARAAALAPEVPLRVVSQVPLPALPAHVERVQCDLAERPAVYAEGDVLLAPSRWEGLGHSLYEAQACGLPVLTTDAPPMNEAGGRGLRVARSARLKWHRKLLSHEVRPEDLAAGMRALHGTSIEEESRTARLRMERGHDLRHVLDELGRAIESAARARTPPVQRPGAASATSDR